MLPLLKSDGARSSKWRTERRYELFHDCVRILAGEINKFCDQDHIFRYADGIYRNTRPFLFFFLMDGLEIAYNTLCPVTSCPTCWCPNDRLHETKVE